MSEPNLFDDIFKKPQRDVVSRAFERAAHAIASVENFVKGSIENVADVIDIHRKGVDGTGKKSQKHQEYYK